MNKIESFKVNHLILNPGFYISRIDGDITTYDLRMTKPYGGKLLSHEQMHTLEHMFATYIRNSEIADDIIYFGPMGCQTGFYLLIRNAEYAKSLKILKETLKKIIDHEGEVFGNSIVECGNYQTLKLESAKSLCEEYLQILNNSVNTGEYK